MQPSFIASGIVVRDLDASQRFYEQVLAMEEVNRIRVDAMHLDEVILRAAGGGSVILMRYDDGRAHAEVGQKLVFSVPDPAAVADVAEAAGGSVTFPATAMPGFGATIAFVRDPDGHTIEVLDRAL